tara:strand:+ start:315 stop:470 length:156 start_codon:yes stop_codon:yes gene_type:complete
LKFNHKLKIILLERINHKLSIIFSAAFDEDIDAKNIFYARIKLLGGKQVND